MSVGFFMGVTDSFSDEALPAADAFIAAINVALTQRNLPPYVDPVPPPDPYVDNLFGRSELDHHGAAILRGLAAYAANNQAAIHLKLIADNPYRVAFLPIEFVTPFETDYRENIAGHLVPIHVGSAGRLLQEVIALAPELGIPLEAGVLPDATAAKINDFAPLYDGDTCELSEDQRTAWLLLYEGARLGVHHHAALSLAG
jgi:hypothetical protein